MKFSFIIFLSFVKTVLNQILPHISYKFSPISLKDIFSFIYGKKSTDSMKINSINQYYWYKTVQNRSESFPPIPHHTYQSSFNSNLIKDTNNSFSCDLKQCYFDFTFDIIVRKKILNLTKDATFSNSAIINKNSTIDIIYCFWIGSYFPYSPILSLHCSHPLVQTAYLVSYLTPMIMSIIIIIIFIL